MRRRGPLVRVIVFHDVTDREWFERVVHMLTSTFWIVTPDQFRKRVFREGKINLLLTFDDGYESWTEVVVPTLKRYGLQGLFFVCSGLLDVYGMEEQKTFVRKRLWLSPKRTLSWEGAQRLIEGGHTIGGHTVHHRDLAKMKQEELASEIVDDRAALKAKFNVAIKDFAYPFGTQKHYTSRTCVAVEEAGYTLGYTAVSGFVPMGGNSFETPRTLIEENQPLSEVKRWIRGGYDMFRLFLP